MTSICGVRLVRLLGLIFVGAVMTSCTTSTSNTGSPSSSGGSGTVSWVDQSVSFSAGGMTIYGTYRHPVGALQHFPGALLIAGSGPTDRNGNSTLEAGPVDTLKTLSDWLSSDGVASLRYDKLGTGQTGLGTFASNVDRIGIAPFEKESLAALKFLSAQKGIEEGRIAVIGHSEGGLFALLLATGHAGNAPPIRASVSSNPRAFGIST